MIRRNVGFFVKSVHSKLTNRLNGAAAQAILTKSENYRFLVGVEDSGVGLNLRSTGVYGAEELRKISGLIDANSEVLFVGAHIGALAIPTAKICRNVYAVEANPDTFELLRMNVAINECKNVRLYNFAAGEADGEIRRLQAGAENQEAYVLLRPTRYRSRADEGA